MIADASRYRVRLKYRADIKMGQSPPSTEYSDLSENGLPFLQGTADFGIVSPTPRVYCGSPTKLAHAGDILFSVRAPVGDLNLADQTLGIGRGLCAIRPQKHWDARFAWWALHEACHQLNFVSTGSTYDAVATEDVGNLLVETTAPSVQRTIADYLDRETARLDALVAAKERILGLLAEKRRALITRAVTRGLDPHAPLRDCGIPWIGEIPEHWSRMQLRRVAQFITSGSRGWAEHYSDSGSLFVRIGNLTRNSIHLDLTSVQYVDPPEGSEGERTKILPGDLLFSITAYLGSIAVAPVGIENAYINQHIALVRLAIEKGLNPVYAGYVSISDIGQAQLVGQGYGGTKTQLALDDVRELWFPMPPLLEQMAIVDRIERETLIIDDLHSATTRTISLFRERRAALITSAVTGRLKVALRHED